MIIDSIADLHGYFPKLKGGDLLIVAGDLTASDHYIQYRDFFEWLCSQEYKLKIVISGNHDNKMENDLDLDFPDENIVHLEDSGIEFEGLKIWGTPWTKTFVGMNPKCKAFTCDTEKKLDKKWALIPDDVDILITHGPPHGILDKTHREHIHVGSETLREHVIGRIKPAFHVFGHIHEWGGKLVDCVSTRFINCSLLNEYYKFVNKPVRVIL